MAYLRPLSQTKFINDANLVSYWKLDGNSNDSKGSNNGTDTSMSYSTGQFDSAGVFNGTSSKIDLPALGVGGSSARTISMWVNISTTGNRCLYNAGTAANLAYTQLLTSTFITGDIIMDFFNCYIKTNAAVLSSSTWTSVIVTYDGTSITTSSFKIYVNGIAVATTLSGSGTANTTNSNYSLGYNRIANSNFTNGSIDDTAIFSRALSAGEVAELYQSMTLGEYLPNSNTKLLLHLNGSSADSSGNNNNGTDTAITYSQANGKFGQGAGFNGSTSNILIPSNMGFTGNSNFTYSVWMYVSSWTSNSAYLELENSTTSNRISFYTANGTTNLAFGKVRRAVTDAPMIAIPSTGVWHNYIATYDNTSGTSSFYMDGKFMNSANLSGDGSGATNNRLYIGVATSSQDEHIYETVAWTPQQVQKYYSNAKARFGII